MKYMGSKNRIAKDIVPIIQQCIDDNNIKTYIEPFCGGCNVIDKIVCDKKIASDKHKYLIAMFNNLDKLSTLPDFIDKEHYSKVRNCFNKQTNEFEDWYIGAIGFLASYNGRFFDGGYSGVIHTKDGKVRNYYDEAKRNLFAQIEQLSCIEFYERDYTYYSNIENCLLYLDPPYQGTKQYGISKDFDYMTFWDWVRVISKKNIVFVSEHNAPNDFKCIWEQAVTRTMDNSKRFVSVERLFAIDKIV